MTAKKESSEPLPKQEPVGGSAASQQPSEAALPRDNARSAAPSNGADEPKPQTPDYYDQLLRLKAEFENFRKRTDRERPEWIRMGEVGLLVKMLPLYDLLLKAHDQVVRQSSDRGASSKELIQGLELIFKEFNKLFESEEVRVIETVGKPYNHDQHEALGFVETDEYPEGTVAEELQRGYTFHGKVLRPARVRTAKPLKREGESRKDQEE